MKKALWSGVMVAAGIMLATSAYAQTQANVVVTAQVGAHAKLTLDAATITFADADPDGTPVLTSPAINIGVKARAAGAVTLTVVANGNLVSGGNSIPIDQLTWAATGAGFTATGISNSVTPQTAFSSASSTSATGTHTYSLPNSWSYATGNYTATLTYTLSAP